MNSPPGGLRICQEAPPNPNRSPASTHRIGAPEREISFSRRRLLDVLDQWRLVEASTSRGGNSRKRSTKPPTWSSCGWERIATSICSAPSDVRTSAIRGAANVSPASLTTIFPPILSTTPSPCPTLTKITSARGVAAGVALVPGARSSVKTSAMTTNAIALIATRVALSHEEVKLGRVRRRPRHLGWRIDDRRGDLGVLATRSRCEMLAADGDSGGGCDARRADGRRRSGFTAGSSPPGTTWRVIFAGISSASRHHS